MTANAHSDIAASIGAYAEKRHFSGWDPYDALASPLLQALSFKTKIGRIFWTQLLRRLPFNPRSLLLVPKTINPKGVGLFLEGYTKLLRNSSSPYLVATCEHLLQVLAATRCPTGSGSSWGYPFPWQSRAAYLPPGTPTIVNTSFIGHSLLDYHYATGSQLALDIASTIPDFITRDLRRMRKGDTVCFSYTPLDENYVHNANMLGASVLLRTALATGATKHIDTACSAIRYSIKHQRPDGSWPYAETGYQSWIDSFHTAFNLEALRWFASHDLHEGAAAALSSGLQFFCASFLLPDGAVRYYHNQSHPFDVHAPTEAICLLSGNTSLLPKAQHVTQHFIQHYVNPGTGQVYYRRYKHFTSRIPYMRWAQAWGFRAMTHAATMLHRADSAGP
jgi:hypothetical protein